MVVNDKGVDYSPFNGSIVKGGKSRISVIRYEPMLLFYQINIDLIRLNAKKQMAFCLATCYKVI